MGKHIAIVIDSLAGGGAEKVMLTLARALQKQGHRPHLLVIEKFCTYDIPSDIPVSFCFPKKEKFITSIWKLSSSVKRVRSWINDIESKHGHFDSFISNLDKSNLLMVRANVPRLFCVVHNSIKAELNREKKLGIFNYLNIKKSKKSLNSQHIITVSDGITREIESLPWLNPKSISRIYNPFEFAQLHEKAEISVDNLPKEPYMIHVGRVAKQKRHDVLFQALKLMNNPIKLVLLCVNVKKAQKLAKRIGVENRIIFVGFQQNPYVWIKNAKLLVLSSDYEGFGMVLVESLALNTPVVSTDCHHGPNEILTDDLKQWLVPTNEPKSLAQALDKNLSQKHQVDNASILKELDANQIAQHYIEVMDQRASSIA